MKIMERNWTINPSPENWVEVQNAIRRWAASVETVKLFAKVLHDGVEDENWKNLLAAVMETAEEAAKQKVHFDPSHGDGIEKASAEILKKLKEKDETERWGGRRRKSKKRKVKKRKSKKSKKTKRRRTKRRR